MKVEIKPDPSFPATHSVVMVESRGRVYAVRWAGPAPSVERVRLEWRRHKNEFRAYDWSTNSFLG